MKRLFLILVVLTTACGREDSNPSSANQRSEVTANPTPVTVSEEEADSSWFAATDADVPACTKDTLGRLVYVSATNVFKACQASGYTEVAIKGKDGKDGAAASATSVNEWTDIISGKKWYFGGYAALAQHQTLCTGKWRVPAYAELLPACHAGIFQAFQNKFGSSTQPTASSSGFAVTISNCAWVSQASNVVSLMVCIEN